MTTQQQHSTAAAVPEAPRFDYVREAEEFERQTVSEFLRRLRKVCKQTTTKSYEGSAK